MYRLILGSITLFVILDSSSLCQGSPVEDVANYGEAFDLQCVDGQKDPTVTWLINGSPLVPKEKEYEIYHENNTMRILKIDPKLMGNFSCTYNNSRNTKEFTIYVNPYIVPFDKTRNVIQGDPLRLDCKAWGIPAPIITWYLGETELKTLNDAKVTLKDYGGNPGDTFPKVTNGTIRIVDMDYKDKGNYSCKATNTIHDTPKEAYAYVAVEVKDKYAALWPFLGICIEVAILCTIILIYERRRAKRIEEEERQEEAAHLNANNDARPAVGGEEVRQRK